MSFNPKVKRYNYTSGGEYTLSGINYVGYFNINNKIARTGRNITSNSQLLTPTSRIATDMYQYEIDQNLIFPDRLIIDNISLPNDLDEIIIPPNEIVTSRIFNAHLRRLYENTLYVYSKLLISSNVLPNGYTHSIGITATDPIENGEQKWNPGGYATAYTPYSMVGFPEIDKSKKCLTIETNDKLNYITFSISDTTFSVISSKADKTKTNIGYTTQNIDLFTDKTYGKIEDIALSNNRFLFISDSENNAIYKYDILAYTTSDITLKDQLFLLDVIGHEGDVKNRSGFNAPKIIEANSDRLYIYDSGNNCVKIYTIDLTWVNTYLLPLDTVIKDIAYNSFHNVVFVLVEQPARNFKILVFDNNFSSMLQEYDLDEKYEEIIDGESTRTTTNRRGIKRFILDPAEELLGIRFSFQDSNIFYVFSNYNIYKKFITKPQSTIGKWSFTRARVTWDYIWNFIDIEYNQLFVTWNTLSGSETLYNYIIDMNLLPQSGNYDDIFVPMRSGDAFRMLYCNELTLYDTVLASADIDIYNTTRFGTLNDEYVNALTINKELYKQAYNIIALKNLLKGKFTGSFNRLGNLVYEQYDYLNEDDINKISIGAIENLYVHENEHVSSEVLNRGLRILYNTQLQLLETAKTKLKNITSTNSLTGLNILRIE